MITLEIPQEARDKITPELLEGAANRIANRLAFAKITPQNLPAEMMSRFLQGETMPTLHLLAQDEYQATRALFAPWAEEDAELTPEEIAREDARWEEIDRNLEQSRLSLRV